MLVRVYRRTTQLSETVSALQCAPGNEQELVGFWTFTARFQDFSGGHDAGFISSASVAFEPPTVKGFAPISLVTHPLPPRGTMPHAPGMAAFPMLAANFKNTESAGNPRIFHYVSLTGARHLQKFHTRMIYEMCF